MVKELPTLDMTVRRILDRWPEVEPLLARRGLDLCCGGVHPLRMAAQAHGLNPDAVIAEILAALGAEARR